jgi:hypothetical protein
MSEVQTGTILEHLETGAEVAYKAAIPTLGHGLLHLLVGAQGYILKFTNELQSEFNVPTPAGVATEDPFAGATSAEVQELLRLLRAKGGPTAAADVATDPVDAEVAADPSPEEADLYKVQPTAEAPAPLAPAPTAGGIAL